MRRPQQYDPKTSHCPKNRVSEKKTKIPTNNNDVELETTLQELMLNLLCDTVETNVGLSTNFFGGGGHFGFSLQ